MRVTFNEALRSYSISECLRMLTFIESFVEQILNYSARYKKLNSQSTGIHLEDIEELNSSKINFS